MSEDHVARWVIQNTGAETFVTSSRSRWRTPTHPNINRARLFRTEHNAKMCMSMRNLDERSWRTRRVKVVLDD